MNSIDENQPEDTRADLSADAAVTRIRAIVDSAKSCFLCTRAAGSSDSDGRFLSANR